MRRVQLHRSFLSTAADAAGGPDRLPAVVCCPGLIQNRFTFEAPTRSFVAALRRAGWCTYVLEPHGRHRDAGGPRRDGLVDYVEHDVAPTVAELIERHPGVAYIGHSLGGLIGVALPAEVSSSLSAMVTVGTPLHPAVRVAGKESLSVVAARLARLLQKRQVAFPGRLVGRAFRVLKPVINAPGMRYPMMIFAPGSLHPRDLDHFLKHSFAQDSFGVVADLLELGRSRGDWAGAVDIAGRLGRLRPPLLVVGGNLDALAPPPSVRALYERAGSGDKTLVELGPGHGGHFGHVDLLIGRLAPSSSWPPILRFLRKHLGPAG